MNPFEALTLIDQALATIQANRHDHAKLQRAFDIVAEVVNQTLLKDTPDEPAE